MDADNSGTLDASDHQNSSREGQFDFAVWLSLCLCLQLNIPIQINISPTDVFVWSKVYVVHVYYASRTVLCPKCCELIYDWFVRQMDGMDMCFQCPDICQ